MMLDQFDKGRTFAKEDGIITPPFGRGINLQIEVGSVAPMLDALKQANILLYLSLEDKWYRQNNSQVGSRQFVVADPDGYLLRFFEPLGIR